MGVYSKSFTIAAGENWTDEGLAINMTFASTASDGNPQPSALASNAVLIHNQSDSDQICSGSGGDTFASVFGIPSGATILSIQCASIDYKYVQGDAGGANRSASIKVRPVVAPNGANICTQDLLNLALPVANTGWTTDTSGLLTTVTGTVTGSSPFRLELQCTVTLGAGNWQFPNYYFDNIVIAVTAQDPTPVEQDDDQNFLSILPPPVPARNFIALPNLIDEDVPLLKGQPDEDYRVVLPAPLPAAHYIQLPTADWEKNEPPVLFGQPDEDFWKAPPPDPGRNWQPSSWVLMDPQDLRVVSTTLGPDEDFWKSWVPPVPASLYQVLPFPGFHDQGDLSPGVIPIGPAIALKAAMSVQQANLWVIARVAANQEFNLNLLAATVDLSATYVVKQVASTPLAGVDGATAGYTWHATISAPWPCIGMLQIYGAANIAYDADVRYYQKMRHRRR